MATSVETRRSNLPDPGLVPGAATAVALLALVAALLEATVDVLPDDPIFLFITPIRVITALGLIALIVAGLRPSRWRTPLDIPVLLLVGAATITCAWTGVGWSSWRGLITVVAIFYLTVGIRRGLPDSWNALRILALVVVSAAALTALSQFANDKPTGFCRASLDGRSDACTNPDAMIRVIGTMTNPNLLAAFLLLFLPLAAAAALSQVDHAPKVVSLAIVAAGYIALLLTFSRAAYVAAVLGLLAWFALRRANWRAIVTVLVGTFALGFVALVGLAVSGASLGVRGRVYRAAVDIALGHPLGVGMGHGGAALQARLDDSLKFQHAHNLWLNWLLETGPLGFLAMGLITFVALLTVARAAQRRSLEAGAIGAGLVGFLTVSLLDDPANAVRIAIAFWIMLGLAVTARGGRSRMRPDEPPTTRAARRALLDEERRRNTPVI